ncbi:MAG TPA: PadR family transcriptional regulator [Gemmatimonadaceae bacterium]|nr:PadR family transcriptional regulator [Gemmatimonadaceae bacterium]
MPTTPADPESLLPLTPLSFHVLVALGDAERHGYGIIKEIEARSDGRIRPGAGTLYAAVQRLQDDGVIEECDGPAGAREADARRRYYRLTAFGRRVARAEALRLARLLDVARAKAIAPELRPAVGQRKA